VSTVGLAPAIRKLADERLQVTVAISLHTPDDELRDTLVPVNNRWPIDEVLAVARYYADVTGRRVSIEYALIRDINDQPGRAELLAKRLREHLTAGSCQGDPAQSPQARMGCASKVGGARVRAPGKCWGSGSVADRPGFVQSGRSGQSRSSGPAACTRVQDWIVDRFGHIGAVHSLHLRDMLAVG
jgi:hypothetical protein